MDRLTLRRGGDFENFDAYQVTRDAVGFVRYNGSRDPRLSEAFHLRCISNHRTRFPTQRTGAVTRQNDDSLLSETFLRFASAARDLGLGDFDCQFAMAIPRLLAVE